MKKMFFRSLAFAAAFVFGTVVFTSCSSEDLDTENLSVDCVKSLIVCDAPVQTTEINAEGQGSARRWTLSDGQTVTARHSGTIDVNNIEIVDINETPGEEDNTTMVNVIVASKSRANTITRSVSYAKMVKVNPDTVVVVKTDTVVVTPPAPQEPTVTKEYFVADTAMVYKNYASGMVRITMNHKLTKVSEWSDGRQDRAEIWDKKFQVVETFTKEVSGRLYTITPASGLKYYAGISVISTEESTEDGVKLTKKNGQFDFNADYVCDADYPQTWDAHIVANATDVEFSYESYTEKYTFDFAVDFINQKEENLNVENEVRGGHEYVYESTSIATWNIFMNGIKLGVTKNVIEIFHF